MPIKEVQYKSQLTGTVDDFLRSRRKKAGGSEFQDDRSDFLNVIEFIEKFKLLPYGLFPVQKFIVKLYYNIPLNEVDKTIKVTDKFGVNVLHEFTEKEYLEFLYDNGRCNIRVQDGKDRRELILVLGRRAGKSELSAIFAAYELYKLLYRGFPQSYYGMPSASEIRVLCVANDKEQASIVFGSMQGHLESVDYFKESVANTTQTFLKFRTEHDKKKFGSDGKASISATFKSSIAKGLRGRGVICAILDEIAFFVDNGKSSAERVYKAIYPSLAQFAPKDPKNRHVPITLPDGSQADTEGRMILISSPDAKDGFFFRQYQKAMSKSQGSENMLVIQAPTWEVNPTLPLSYYEQEYHKDPTAFMTEHGAEFSDRVRGWIQDARDLLDCVDEDYRPSTAGIPREIHFAGVDFGIVKDGTAINLTRIRDGKIELAYHEVWYPRKKWKEANPHLESPLVDYALTLQDRNRLDIEEIANWFWALSKRFYLHKGVFDQWAGPVFEQILHKKGLHQFEMRNFFNSDSSSMYQILHLYMLNKQLRLYDWPISGMDSHGKPVVHSPLIAEILELQASSAGKNIVIVEAPKITGKHDDSSDAFARSVLLASEYLKANPHALRSGSLYEAMSHTRQAVNSYHAFQRQRARMGHAPPRERSVPASMRRR
jgi:hypothetical protein